MTKVKKFEDVIAWQKVRELVKMVYEMTREGDFARDFSLKDQIRRAAVSVMSNIAEGFSGQTDKEFVQFFISPRGLFPRYKANYMWLSIWAMLRFKSSIRLTNCPLKLRGCLPGS